MYVECPMCDGKAFFAEPDNQRRKCPLCDNGGQAFVQDVIDYYTHIEPNKNIAKRFTLVKKDGEKGGSN